MKMILSILTGILIAAAIQAQTVEDFATKLTCEIQTAGIQSLDDLTWMQGTTPLIRLDVQNDGRPVDANTNAAVRMIIGPSGTVTNYAVVTNYSATSTSYYVQWPTVGTNSSSNAWFYTVYFELDGYRYWTGAGDLYIEETTSTAADGLHWQEITYDAAIAAAQTAADWASNAVVSITNDTAGLIITQKLLTAWVSTISQEVVVAQTAADWASNGVVNVIVTQGQIQVDATYVSNLAESATTDIGTASNALHLADGVETTNRLAADASLTNLVTNLNTDIGTVSNVLNLAIGVTTTNHSLLSLQYDGTSNTVAGLVTATNSADWATNYVPLASSGFLFNLPASYSGRYDAIGVGTEDRSDQTVSKLTFNARDPGGPTWTGDFTFGPEGGSAESATNISWRLSNYPLNADLSMSSNIPASQVTGTFAAVSAGGIYDIELTNLAASVHAAVTNTVPLASDGFTIVLPNAGEVGFDAIAVDTVLRGDMSAPTLTFTGEDPSGPTWVGGFSFGPEGGIAPDGATNIHWRLSNYPLQADLSMSSNIPASQVTGTFGIVSAGGIYDIELTNLSASVHAAVTNTVPATGGEYTGGVIGTSFEATTFISSGATNYYDSGNTRWKFDNGTDQYYLNF